MDISQMLQALAMSQQVTANDSPEAHGKINPANFALNPMPGLPSNAAPAVRGSSMVPRGNNDNSRPYQNVPDPLMGFRTTPGPNKGFDAERYPYTQGVQITPPQFMGQQEKFVDSIKGMNPAHAMERARRNWEGAVSYKPMNPGDDFFPDHP